ESDQRGEDDDDRGRRVGRPVVARVAGGEEAVRVRAEAVEGDVTKVEEAGEADDDVQSEAEQDVQEREDAEARERVAAGEDREEGRRDDEDRETAERREALPDREDEPAEPGRPLTPALMLRDPLVDADARTVGGVGALWEVGLGHQTFLMSARPSRPLGRTRMT